MKPVLTPKGRHEWTPKKKSPVLSLIPGGKHTIRQISFQEHVPRFTVRDIKRRDTVVSEPCSCRPKSHSPTLVCWFVTSRRIIQFIVNQQGHWPSNTIKAVLRDAGYNRRIARHRPFLKNKDHKSRLKFGRKFVNWTNDDWKRIIWTNERNGTCRSGLDLEKDRRGISF